MEASMQGALPRRFFFSIVSTSCVYSSVAVLSRSLTCLLPHRETPLLCSSLQHAAACKGPRGEPVGEREREKERGWVQVYSTKQLRRHHAKENDTFLRVSSTSEPSNALNWPTQSLAPSTRFPLKTLSNPNPRKHEVENRMRSAEEASTLLVNKNIID
jgi:hypothetical protein